MRYMRCKCGDSVAWTSMGSPACRVCSKCGSTLAEGPEGHIEPQPHEWVELFHERTGNKYKRCTRCGIEDGYESASEQ